MDPIEEIPKMLKATRAADRLIAHLRQMEDMGAVIKGTPLHRQWRERRDELEAEYHTARAALKAGIHQ